MYRVNFHGSGVHPDMEVDFTMEFHVETDEELKALIIEIMEGEHEGDPRIVGGPPPETSDCRGYADDVVSADHEGVDVTEMVDRWWRYGFPERDP